MSTGDFQHFSRKSKWMPGEKQKYDRKKGWGHNVRAERRKYTKMDERKKAARQ